MEPNHLSWINNVEEEEIDDEFQEIVEYLSIGLAPKDWTTIDKRIWQGKLLDIP